MSARILTLDIETSPHKAYAFGVWQENILPAKIIEPTRMLTWAAKFKGERTTYYDTYRSPLYLEGLSDLLNEADIIVHYNGDKFDMPHINREFIEAGIAPPRPCPTIDLLKVVRKRFKFPHNRLDYVCGVLLDEHKLETGGFELWPAFMGGDLKAQRVMERYNKRDVRLTERLYTHLREWILNHPYGGSTHEVDDASVTYECPACGSTNTTKERPRRTRCYSIRVVRCSDCGSWSDGRRKKI